MAQPKTADNLIAYYAARAAEYDDVYLKPERQDDLAALRSILRELRDTRCWRSRAEPASGRLRSRKRQATFTQPT